MLRKCTKCGEEKELNEENFAIKKANQKGFENYCKACKKEKDAQRYQANREKILQQKKEYYQRKKDMS